VDLPPSGGCVVIDYIPPHVRSIQATWKLSLDPAVPLYIIAGALLFWGRRVFRESKTVHALIGAACMVVLGALIVMCFLWRQASRAVPFSGVLTGLILSLFYMVPSMAYSMGYYFLIKTMPTSLDFMFPLLEQKGYLVAILIPVSIAVVVGARWGLWWFSPNSACAPGEVEFTIGRDGRRIDKLPADPLQQRLLGFLLGAAGMALLMCSTHSVHTSSILAVAVLLKSRVVHFLHGCGRRRGSQNPTFYRKPISGTEYHAQSRIATSQGLRELRNYAMYNPETFIGLRSVESELRLRRFCDGFPHYRSEIFDPQDDARRCSIL